MSTSRFNECYFRLRRFIDAFIGKDWEIIGGASGEFSNDSLINESPGPIRSDKYLDRPCNIYLESTTKPDTCITISISAPYEVGRYFKSAIWEKDETDGEKNDS